jgi:hypothetical protein
MLIDCNEHNPIALAFGWFVVSRGKKILRSRTQEKCEIKREDYCSISEDYQSAQLEEILECPLSPPLCRRLVSNVSLAIMSFLEAISPD